MDDSIDTFFEGKSIFITGGTGFMGKVLIEKLLRSCSNVEKLYVLVRPSKGKTPAEKLQHMYTLPLFNLVKEEQGEEIFEKVQPIEGDVKKLGLGISPEDRKLLTEKVSIVIHAAASVRFDDPLHEAIIINTRGTRELVELVKQMKNIQALIHVSTTFCNCYRQLVEEKPYPAPMDWRDAIYTAERITDPVSMNILSKVYLGAFPNTYVFTKNLAEQILVDECKDIPTLIFRPSIVIASLSEPFPGWVDNFNGPVGFFIGIGKGVIRTTLTTSNTRPDYMPVDISIKGILVASYAVATGKIRTVEPGSKLSVINCASGYRSITVKELMDIGREFGDRYPLNDYLWPPGYIGTPNKTCYYVNVMLKQVFPAMLIDFALKVLKKPPMHIVKLQRKIYRATTELGYFTLNDWTFLNANFYELETHISKKDKATFKYNVDDVDPREYLGNAIIGGHKYLLKTDVTALPYARKRHTRFVWLDRSIKLAFWLSILWYLYKNYYLYYVNKYLNITFELF